MNARHLGWEKRKKITLTAQEKCLEWNEVAGGINLFGFQVNWLIFLFGDKLKRKKYIHFHLWISNLCICAAALVIYLCQAIHITQAFCSVLRILLLSWKQCQLKKWAEHSACQILSARWVMYRVTCRISEIKGLEASFYPSDWEWKVLQRIHKAKDPFRCVCGGINPSAESPAFLFMLIFNIFDKFHNYRCLYSLNK